MASEIRLPELGENVESGTIVEIAVKVGDEVSAGQTLIEVEAGKSTVPVPAPSDGKITAVLVNNGDEVKTDQVLFKVESAIGASESKSADDEKKEKSKQQESSKKEVTTEKSQSNGEASKSSATAEQKSTQKPRFTAPAGSPPTSPGKLVPASPATRLLARELGVDINRVQGSGRHGRVTQEDLKAFVRQLSSGTASSTGTNPAPTLPDFSKWGAIDAKPLSGIRKETAKQMSISWTTIPHVTQHDLADITDLEAFRKSQPKSGPRITVTAFALKAVAIALEKFPQFAASLDMANNQLIYKKYYHIGLAVDTDKGLLVPVLRDVDKKSVHELAAEMANIAERARDGKISLADMQGGTFTVTNLGGIGGTAFTPIVNHPEVAILGMSRSRIQPVWEDNQWKPRLMLPLSLSYDHRVIDGADAARFTRLLADMLEKPLNMLLHA